MEGQQEMMTVCPKCESTDIVQNLLLLAGYGDQPGNLAYVAMVDPEGKSESVETSFRIDVCGSCGYSEMRTKFHADLREASRKGYESREMG